MLAAALLAVTIQPAFAEDVRPTEESLRQLFQVMHSSQLLDSYVAQVDATMHASMREAMQGTQLNAEEQQILNDMSSELVALLKNVVNWESMQPMMTEVYRNTFSQREVDDMLKFYRSPTGQAVVSKLPAAVQQAMQTMQQRVNTLTPKIMELQRDTMAALKRAQERQAAGANAPSQAPQPPRSPQPSQGPQPPR
jgi:hypothetical protein